VGWAVGVVAAAAVAVVPFSLFLRVELSLLAGGLGSLLAMSVIYLLTIRSREQDAPRPIAPVYDPAQPLDDALGTDRD
jgi:ABC-type Fe3+-siderophore transport system permease subunit